MSSGEIRPIESELVKLLRSQIGKQVEIGHIVTLSGVGTKGIIVAIDSPFGGTYEFPVFDLTFVRPAPEAR